MRIIGGSARGRSYEAPEGMTTRPTLVRVRKSVFDALQFRFAGAHVLDLFSGSGGLGLEAASRGAAFVLCNDKDRNCARLIRQNAENVRLSESIEVWQMDFLEAIRRMETLQMRFDLSFIDAPYFEGSGEQSVRELFKRRLIRPDGLVVWEHSALVPFSPCTEGVRVSWERTYGEITVTMLAEEEV